MTFDALLLARLQFAFTISAHIIFPAFSIGLAAYLATLEALALSTGRRVYMDTFDFLKPVFALVFGMGVVSGLVMSYQFGSNWSVFSDKTGPVLGPLLGYEVLTAFFLEAGFLGVMLFGREKVGPILHFVATAMVALGTLVSMFWILAANSWMQTPAGHAVNAAGQFTPANWYAVIFNPSFPYRFTHMALAAFLTTAFAVGGAGAWRLMRAQDDPVARTMFSMAMWMAACVAPLQIAAGDLHGLNTLEHQPAKIAAMEGHFETQRGAPLYLFGWPDMTREVTRYPLAIPRLGSLILTHSLDGEVRGLKSFPAQDRPNATILFWSFRVMVGIGFAMVALGLWSIWSRWRGRLFDARGLRMAALAMSPMGFVAVLAGWITTEVGRQPWLVYGLLRTAEGVSPVAAPAIGASLLAFIVIYLFVFGAGAFYVVRLIGRGPQPDAVEQAPTVGGISGRLRMEAPR